MDQYEDEEDERNAAASPVGVVVTLFRFLWPFARHYRALCLALAGGIGFEMLYNASFPLAMRELIDNALVSNEGQRGVLILVLIVLATGGLASSAVGIAADYVYARLSAGIVRDLRGTMLERLMTLSMRFFARNSSADVLQRFSSDVGVLENSVTTAVPWGVIPAMDVVSSTVLLFVLEWRLALVAMLVFPLGIIGPRFFSPRAVSASHERKQHESAALSVVQQVIAGQAVVKAFGLEREAFSWFRKRNALLFDRTVRMGFLGSMVERSNGIAILLLHVLVIGIGAHMAFEEIISVGTLLIFESVFLTLSYGIGYVAQYLPTLVHSAGGMRRLSELLNEQPDIVDAPDAIELGPVQDGIEFDHVTFGYGEHEPPLRDVTLRIEHGERVVIVGPSGSGKSTFIGLLLRLWDPSAGVIRIDGHDLRKVTQSSLRAQVGAVFQDSVLFEGTIRENIRLGRLNATDAEVEAAARASGVHEFTMAMPDGYESTVGERGGRLSGGQRQRVAIARALLRNPAILLVDEGTSGLNQENESLVLRAMSTAGGERTVILVTHRPEAIHDADRTLHLEGGTLHDEHELWADALEPKAPLPADRVA